MKLNWVQVQKFSQKWSVPPLLPQRAMAIPVVWCCTKSMLDAGCLCFSQLPTWHWAGWIVYSSRESVSLFVFASTVWSREEQRDSFLLLVFKMEKHILWLLIGLWWWWWWFFILLCSVCGFILSRPALKHKLRSQKFLLISCKFVELCAKEKVGEHILLRTL